MHRRRTSLPLVLSIAGIVISILQCQQTCSAPPSATQRVVQFHFPNLPGIGKIIERGAYVPKANRLDAAVPFQKLADARGDVKLTVPRDAELIFDPGPALIKQPSLVKQIDPAEIRAINFEFHSLADNEDSFGDQLVGEFTHFNNLVDLSLSDCDVSSKGLSALAKGKVGLITLDLNKSLANKDCLPAILSFKKLQSLSLCGCDLTGFDVNKLAELKDLKSLDLGKTLVTDAQIANLNKSGSLEKLRVADNDKITDRSLAVLKSMPKLGWIDISNTSITAQGVDALRKNKSLQVIYSKGASRSAPPTKEELKLFAPTRF